MQLLECENEEQVIWLVTKYDIAKLNYVDYVVYMQDSDHIHLTQMAAHGPKNPIDFDIDNPIRLRLGEGISGTIWCSRNNIKHEIRFKV